MSEAESRENVTGGEGVDAATGAFGRIGLAWDEGEAARLTAECVLGVFDAYHAECRRITWQAKTAFEERQPGESLRLSRRRLTIYSETIHAIAARLNRVFPGLADDEALWREVEETYFPLIAGRYEEDLAIA